MLTVSQLDALKNALRRSLNRSYPLWSIADVNSLVRLNDPDASLARPCRWLAFIPDAVDPVCLPLEEAANLAEAFDTLWNDGDGLHTFQWLGYAQVFEADGPHQSSSPSRVS